MVTLQGHGFILRPYRKGDELSLQEHINDREIAHNTLTIPYPYTLKDAKQWIGKCLKDDKKKVLQEAVFALTVDGAVVGSFLQLLEACAHNLLPYLLSYSYLNVAKK